MFMIESILRTIKGWGLEIYKLMKATDNEEHDGIKEKPF